MLGRAFLFSTLTFVTGAACAVGESEVPDGSLILPDVAVKTHDAKVTTTVDATVTLPEASPGIDAGADADAGDAGDVATVDADAGTVPDAPLEIDTGVDAPVETHDAGCPVGMTGPGCTSCANGYHLCGSTCTANGPNNPSTGCSTGCGSTCPAPNGQVASCTADGACAAACPTGQKMCSGVCAACCTNSDCAANVTCVDGTCSGTAACPAGFGTCNTPCDTDLTSNDNCGSCGDSCCTGALCGCGFAGLFGCNCSGSGDVTTYSCQ